MATIYGTLASDFLIGLNGSDTIWGFTGTDWLWGYGGDDALIGGDGADYLYGGTGTDTGHYIDSNAGVYVDLAAGVGYGGTAQGDTLAEIENLWGSVHHDTLVGDGGSNSLLGDLGNDTLSGGGGQDMLQGGEGSDYLTGGGGADHLYGGSGIDVAGYGASPAGVIVSLLTGAAYYGDAAGDTLYDIENLNGSAHADGLSGDDGVNVLGGMSGNDDLKGYGGDDTLWGGTGHDDLYGMDGNDALHGGDGNDYLDGGLGADTMGGGLGNDIYVVDSANDVVAESAGQGVDEVRISTSWTLTAGADVETLRTTNDNGTGFIMLTGNSSGNQIVGNNGSNVIDGGGGTDQLEGRGGDDQYIVDSFSDTITEAGGQGIDTVYARSSYTLNAGADVEGVQTVNSNGVTAINLTGNETGNNVTGNAGHNILNGGDGNDELTGLGGYDSFLFNTTLDADFNMDHITDFNVAEDRIMLSDSLFSSIYFDPFGDLAAGQLVVGTAALDANDRIIYDSNTGALFYDSDGVGGTAQIQFAELDPGLALTNVDFYAW